MISWRMTITGDPIGKGRPRFGNGFAYTPRETRSWEKEASELMGLSWHTPPLDCPVELDIVAVFKRPKRLMRKCDPEGRIPHTAKPDWDNAGKILSDSLTKAGIIRDDSLVWRGRVTKLYAAKNEEPKVEVVMTVNEGVV